MGKKLSAEELNQYSKEDLVTLLLSMQDQVERTQKTMDLMLEQLAVAKQHRFGRSSEKVEMEDAEQLSFFNECEAAADPNVQEPRAETVVPALKKKKQKGKREADLKNFTVRQVRHTLSQAQLQKLFGNRWKQLPDEVYKKLEYHPASYCVVEHHVAVYAGTDNQTIVKADRPAELLRNSLATPSLVSAILNAKYVNAMPLRRIEKEFLRRDVHLSEPTMSNWVITCGERYLSLVYDRLHRELYTIPVLQADETPVEVSKDGRPAGAKSYMWVYRNGKLCPEKPIALYDYQKTRNTSHPREFLQEYAGTVVTDGYQVYHTLDKEREELRIAGCWSHARRRFANIVKSLGTEKAKGTLAYEALRQIAVIFSLEKELTDLSPEERLTRRQNSVKPLVEAYFAWVKEHREQVPTKSETGKGFTYCLNQEPYLKEFLNNGLVPLDNNAAEFAIRGFCIGRKNWVLIDTVAGAKASAIVYSIVETAKANRLKIYEYLEHLLTEIPKHMDDHDLAFLDALLPWSEALPATCRKNL